MAVMTIMWPLFAFSLDSWQTAEENFNYIMRKKMDLGIVSCNPVRAAAEKKTDFSPIRRMSMEHTSDQHWFVRKESPIQSIPTLKIEESPSASRPAGP